MSEMITVQVKEQKYKVPEKTTFLQVAGKVQKEYPYEIILAKVGTRLYELNKEVSDGEEIEFLTIGDQPGHSTYVRGCEMLFLRSIYAEFGSKKLHKVQLEHALGDGYYFDVACEEEITQAHLSNIEKKMRQYVEEDVPFQKTNMHTEKVREMFRQYGMLDKDRLFKYRRTSHTNIYQLGNFQDYFYGYMPPSCGLLRWFSLEKYGNGIILLLPDTKTPETMGKLEVPKKLFFTMEESNDWGNDMGLGTVGELNDAISRGESTQMVLVQEAYQERQIANIAQEIKNQNRRVIMIAGPSSSGKTSFSHRLSIQLTNCGLKAHPLGIDNYFVEREKTPKDEKGDYDYECLEALDIQQFNEHVKALLSGENVDMPTFNFKLGRQEFLGDSLRLEKDEVLVIEGIHGLNDRLSYAIPKEEKYKIYISCLTQLNVDEHNRIPTTDGRLIRRMVRDARTRGSSARDTISRWPSVRRGEEKHIFPFQEEADVMFNSAMIYELGVLKQFAEPLLFGISPTCEEYIEAKRLLKFLEYFLTVSTEEVPHNSLLREFIGGSIFRV